MNKGFILVFLTIFITSSAFLWLSLRKDKNKVRSIVIDAGHGGKDPGNLGSKTKEKDITLAVSLELGRIIKKNMPDVQIYYTRTKDAFVELYKRPKVSARNNADLFISIHCNSTPKKLTNRAKVKGTETFVMGMHVSEENLEVAKRENASIYIEDDYKNNYKGFDPNSPESYILLSLHQKTQVENSLSFAQKIENEFKTRVKRSSRGVKQAGFVVLAKNTVPSVLIELGFLSNPEEEKFLSDALGQVYMASAIFRAFRAYKEEIEGK